MRVLLDACVSGTTISVRNSELALPPVLYEDEALLALDKPGGLLVAPDRWDREQPDLMRLVHERLSPDWFNAHRLDRGTSGVFVCARAGAALRDVCGQFERGLVQKVYVALCRGAPPADSGQVAVPLGPDDRRPGRVRVRPDGKPAETAYEVVERWGAGFALVHLRPHTGRTHQVRVHLAHLGCPVVADDLYGDGRGFFLSEVKRGYRRGRQPERPLIGRLALHAERVTLRHPATGADLTIQAPLPADFERALKYLRRHERS